MYCISVSHKKAPVNIREKFALSNEEKAAFIQKLKKNPQISGCVVLCTCNRSEIYITGSRTAIGELQREVAEFKNLSLQEILKYLNLYSGDRAIAHLFKVCCGFDSMVLGEDEILGQVRDAYQLSLEQNGADYELNVLFQRALAAAKRIKTDTNLSRTPLSIATLVANEVFHFEKEGEKRVMVIGMSGKMGSTITKNILSKPGIQVTGTYRSHKPDFVMEVKSERVKLVEYKDRYRYMNDMDIVVSATSGPHYTVTKTELDQVLTDRKKRLFIDVAVPIDMDPEIRSEEGLTLYDIDYFETLSKNNTEIKMRELDRARALMEEDLDAAVREMMFHPYIRRMGELHQAFDGKKLETVLFKIRDHVSSDDLKVILRTLDGLEHWLREE
ncbi:MAG TPA: glutamyl-tRNA reductase [Candidatus Lachnoclostridium pullistercoris]|uniref:Glutamyl-tRNA reductase n=1 Tax=Candidatus Lachnoclostridium pullistercoris TaxID=2838632 RepID=A0A9D2PCY6_9FIRM|nr:glutamyl-tRNA reductase [Candidatus Lachnoclostridium pullistercoris]